MINLWCAFDCNSKIHSYICRLFVDRVKVTSQVETHLNVNSCSSKKEPCVVLKPYEAITEEVKRLAKNAHAKIWVSPITVLFTHFLCLITTGRFQRHLHVRLWRFDSDCNSLDEHQARKGSPFPPSFRRFLFVVF